MRDFRAYRPYSNVPVIELLEQPTPEGYPGKLSPEDLDRIRGYLSLVGETGARLGYAHDDPHISPHQVELPYCGNCGAIKARCPCHWSHTLPVGVLPTAKTPPSIETAKPEAAPAQTLSPRAQRLAAARSR